MRVEDFQNTFYKQNKCTNQRTYRSLASLYHRSASCSMVRACYRRRSSEVYGFDFRLRLAWKRGSCDINQSDHQQGSVSCSFLSGLFMHSISKNYRESWKYIFMLFRTFFEAFRYDKLKKVFLQMFTLFRNLVTFGNFTNLLLKTFAKTHFLSLFPQLRWPNCICDFVLRFVCFN